MTSTPFDTVSGIGHDTVDEGLGNRARSKAINRQKIIDSARILFSTSGFYGATLRDIAEQANLSTGAVFANFSDKIEIFNLILNEELLRVGNVLQGHYDPGLSFSHNVLNQFKAVFYEARKNIGIFRSAIIKLDKDTEVDLFEAFVRNVIKNFVERSIIDYGFSPTKDIDHIITMSADLTRAHTRRALFNKMSDEDIFLHILTQCEIIEAALKG